MSTEQSQKKTRDASVQPRVIQFDRNKATTIKNSESRFLYFDKEECTIVLEALLIRLNKYGRARLLEYGIDLALLEKYTKPDENDTSEPSIINIDFAERVKAKRPRRLSPVQNERLSGEGDPGQGLHLDR